MAFRRWLGVGAALVGLLQSAGAEPYAGGDATVSIIDAQTLAGMATVGVGQRPKNMALTPDGKKLYVDCCRSGSVSVIDVDRAIKVADVPVGKLPWGVAIR